MLDEFRRIAETATPLPIQTRLVTPDEARAVISSFNRLTDGALRSNFMKLPVDNIIEFSMMQNKKRPSLYNYISTKVEQPIPESERDHLDAPAAIPPPPPQPQPIVETKAPRKKPQPSTEEKFFRHLTERLEHLSTQTAAPTPVVIETTEKHVEKLLEVEQAMVGAITSLTERVEQIALAEDTRVYLTEMLSLQKDLIDRLTTSQQQITLIQSKLIDSQAQMIESMTIMAEKIAAFTQTPPLVNPVVNVPAPIVNVSLPEGRRTKTVERDANNLISRIVEGYEE